MSNNPWGPQDSGGSGEGSGGGEPDTGGPRNPWTPGPTGPKGGGGGGGRGPSLEELLRKGGGPRLPADWQGKPIWLYILILFLILWVAITSVWRLAPEQEGVVTTLGSYSRTVGPGISFTLPMPFERMEKVDARAIRTTLVGKVGEANENFVLTSDQNLIDMAYEVRWSVKSPAQYLFQLEDPEATVKEVAESAMRAAVANFKLTDAIGPGRGDIETQVRTRMQAILDEYGAGIRVQSITIRESDPPSEVKDAFRNVNAAQQRRESYLNEARAYAQQVKERAEGDATSFNKVYEQYRLAPDVTRRRMYYETMEQILQNADKTVVEARGVTPYLPLPEVKSRAAKAASAPATEATPAKAKGE